MTWFPRPTISLLSLSTVAFVLQSPAAFADEMQIDPDQSTFERRLDIAIPLSGELIGDYDAKANPDGTQTRPGLFGGSGNQPVDYSADIQVSSPTAISMPSGSLEVDLSNLDDGVIEFGTFDIDALAGGSSTFSVGISFLFATFRTFDPFSLYPGGIEIPLPAQEGDLTQTSIRSTTVQQLAVDSIDDGYSFAGTLQVDFVMEFDPGTGSQVVEFPFVLPVSGEVSLDAEGSMIRFASSLEVQGDTPVEFPPFEAIPLELPTFPIPSDDTAGILMGGAVTTITADIFASFEVVAFGGPVGSPADFNGDGQVNGADLGFLISAWGVCDGCPQDLNGDGAVNGADLGLFISEWSA